MPFPVDNAPFALKIARSEQSVVDSLEACHAFRDAAANVFPFRLTNAPLEHAPAAVSGTTAADQCVCRECGMAFQREDSLRRHIKAAHSG